MVESTNAPLADAVEEQKAFQQQREIWESQRQDEVDRLRQEATLLAEAWQRLESQQRALLVERELLRQGLTRNSQTPFSRDAGTSLARPPDFASPDAAASHAKEQDQTAWLQFQKLRREMQRYGRSES